MKIFISGTSGFIGQYLIEYLDSEEFELHRLNLRENIDNTTLDGADVVIHLAGRAHDLKNVSSPEDYYDINFGITKRLFDLYLKSKATKFIFISSVKAVADEVSSVLTEEDQPTPKTHYGKSKLMAEEYIRNQPLPNSKSIYILRPCIVYGPGNKGNLNLLYKFVVTGIPWPLGGYNNRRSFTSIENLCFVLQELICRNDIPQGDYQVADDMSLSTNDLVALIGEAIGKSPKIFKFPKVLILWLTKIGDILHLPFNSDTLGKLTSNYVVSNKKLLKAIGKSLPVQTNDGIRKTIQSFQK